MGDEGRGNGARPLLLPAHLVLNEEPLPASARAEDDADLFAVRVGDLEPRVAQGSLRRGHTPVNLGAGAANLLGVEELGDVKVLHLAGNHVWCVGGWVPVGDLRDAAATFGE